MSLASSSGSGVDNAFSGSAGRLNATMVSPYLRVLPRMVVLSIIVRSLQALYEFVARWERHLLAASNIRRASQCDIPGHQTQSSHACFAAWRALGLDVGSTLSPATRQILTTLAIFGIF